MTRHPVLSSHRAFHPRKTGRWAVAGRALLLASLVLGASSAASAQTLPERVPIGESHMTVGFELKTTTHGDGPNGRTSAHSLMKLIRPKSSARWGEEDRAKVERWSSMSVSERTAFFFNSYRGGHESTNFEVDVDRHPYLDGTVSWYGSMNIPHIEIRSNPYDSPRAAMADMERLRSTHPETIAFHMHTRFPETEVASRGEAVTDWLRRVSWAVALRRADYSSRTDFVLKSMDNQPINVSELNKALRAFSAETPRAMSDIVERRGIRVSRLNNGNGTHSLDIEFRGLMRDTGRLRRYLRLTADAFGNGRLGPWEHSEGSPFREHSSENAIKFRTFGWHGTGEWEPKELKWLAEEVKRSRERFGIETPLSPAELAAAVKRLATADTEAGKKMLLPSSFNWLFLPIEHDRALPEGVQEGIEEAKARYMRKLVRLAERVHGGEFGTPGQPGYQPLAVASRARRVLYDFMNERYADAGRRAKLFEWYETSLFEPEEVEERTRRWRTETGRNRATDFDARRVVARAPAAGAEDVLRGAMEGESAENRGSRSAPTASAPTAPAASGAPLLAAEVARVAPAIRSAIGEAYPNVHWMASDGHRNLEVRVVDEAAPRISALIRRAGSRVTISRGMLDSLAEETGNMSEEKAKAFRARAMVLLALDAANRATSMELNVEAAARGSSVIGETGRLSDAELARLRRACERAGVEMPRVAERVNRPRTGATEGVLPEGAARDNLRRIRDRTSSGRRGRRAR